MLDIIGALGGGAITGLIGSITTAVANFKIKKLELAGKKDEYAHEENMIKAESDASIAESKAQMEIQKERTRGEVEKAEIDAFSKSLDALKVSSFKESYMERLEKAGPVGRFAVVLVSLALAGVDVLKGTMRPVLTYYLICATSWVTYMAYNILDNLGLAGIDQAWALAMFEKVTLTVVYLTVSCVTWWFADRRMAKFLATQIKGGTK